MVNDADLLALFQSLYFYAAILYLVLDLVLFNTSLGNNHNMLKRLIPSLTPVCQVHLQLTLDMVRWVLQQSRMTLGS